MNGEIVWLGRYPVKSMLGEDLAEAVLDDSGIVGDRRCALVDRETGLVASAKYPRKWHPLLTMAARCGPDGVVVTLPDGTAVAEDDPSFDEVLSRALGRPVHLAHSRKPDAQLERLATELDESPGELTRGTLAEATPGDTFVDYGPLHVLTTATLDALSREHPHRTVAAARFRPNVIVRMTDEEPFVENGWPDRVLSVGSEAILRVVKQTARCVVPTLAQGRELADDPDVLRTAARLNRVDVPDRGMRTCVGAYASVERAGPLRVGDLVTLT